MLWVRAYHEIYNPEMAIKVLRLVKNIYPDATLTMCGPIKDDSRKKCHDLSIQLNLADSITFLGKIEKAQINELGLTNDIFINTTRIDNFPVTVLEALAMGLCVVSTNVGGIRYMLEHGKNALLTDDGDIVTMATYIDRIVRNKELSSNLNREGRKYAETFDISYIYPQWLKVISKEVKHHH